MIKKISLFLAISCCTIIFSGCSAIDLGKIGAGENDPAMLGEKVVATLHNHIRSGAVEDFDKYFVEDEDTRKMYNDITNVQTMKDTFLQSAGDISQYISQETTDKWVEMLSSKIYGASDYTIDSTVVDGHEVDVTVTMMLPDFHSAQDVTDEDINLILEECFEFDVNDPDAFFAELALRKGVEESKLREIYSSGDEKVYIKDILELFSDEFSKCASLIMDKTLENCPLENYRIEYTVEKHSDGNYKITDVDKI